MAGGRGRDRACRSTRGSGARAPDPVRRYPACMAVKAAPEQGPTAGCALPARACGRGSCASGASSTPPRPWSRRPATPGWTWSASASTWAPTPSSRPSARTWRRRATCRRIAPIGPGRACSARSARSGSSHRFDRPGATRSARCCALAAGRAGGRGAAGRGRRPARFGRMADVEVEAVCEPARGAREAAPALRPNGRARGVRRLCDAARLSQAELAALALAGGVAVTGADGCRGLAAASPSPARPARPARVSSTTPARSVTSPMTAAPGWRSDSSATASSACAARAPRSRSRSPC